MSTHLIPMKTGNEQIPVQYRTLTNLNPGSVASVVHNAMLYYMVQQYGYYDPDVGAVTQLYRLNMFTGEAILYATFTKEQLTRGLFNRLGAILVDDENLYITPRNDGISIITFKLRDPSIPFDPNTPLTFVRTSVPGAWGYRAQAYGRLQWYDKNTICMPAGSDGIAFYIKQTGVWYRKMNTQGSPTTKDFAVGKKFIFLTNSASSSDTVFGYRIGTNPDLFFKFSLPTTNPAVVCYDPDHKRFYFANANYLYIYDEETETIVDTFNVPWTQPFSIHYSMNAVYVLCEDSDKAYVYNIDDRVYMSFTMKYTISTSASYATYACVSDGFWFIPRNQLCIVDYTGYSKYNFGYKYNSLTILCNKQTMNQFQYDQKFVTFDDTFMGIHDGIITYDFVKDETDPRFKIAKINKDDYKFINRTEFN